MTGGMTDEEHAAAEGTEESAESLPSTEPAARTSSALDDEGFEVPSGRYLGLFGAVGAVVGLAVGIQQNNAAFGMAIGLAIGVAVGLLLNRYTAR